MIRLGLTGYPLDHSLSPRLHAAALQAVGLDGEYKLYPVAPADSQGLEVLMGRVRSGELTGLNVTIPHKQAVISLLDDLAPAARAVGAVNTIFMKNGRLMGDNTDAPGFLQDLHRFVGAQHAAPLQTLILGAGGSARAIAYALANDGWEVTIAARRLEQAASLISSLKSARSDSRFSVLAYPLPTSSPVSVFSLIVNTTPIGMFPEISASPWPDGLTLPEDAAVYDLVYNPRQTLLIRQALAAGLRAQTGIGMLVEQAALAFEIWTGCRPPRDVMFAAVEE